VLPAPAALFRALHLAPREAVRVVILGQDPYPTPGHADGLAFSHAGGGWLPASLARIFRERASDLGLRDRTSEGLAPRPATGDLSGWARQGVLLLNASLSVETGRAGSHLAWGWQALARDVIAALGAGGPKARPVVFILWGNAARAMGAGIDRVAHLVIESAHPSPLAARGDFLGSRPFSRANAFLIGRGLPPIDWLAGPGHA
jgi:uracil-DNA glycosylase